MTQHKPARSTTHDIDPIVEEATGWFVAMQDGSTGAEERQAFLSWRDADVRHAATYDRLQHLWSASSELESLKTQPSVDRRSVLRGGAGVGVAAVSLFAGGRLLLGPHPFADYKTGPGERRTVRLPDQSQVELSAATAFSIEFSRQRRLIRLHSGEAWFQVKSDNMRPFVVDAANGRTTAMGTAFAVSTQEQGALVTVTEHAVRVATLSETRQVHEGQSLRYGKNVHEEIRDADPSLLSWRDGRLSFINRPLHSVAAELDRWTGGHTVIADRAIAQRPVTLMISTDEAEDGLTRLASAIPIRITRLSKYLTVIRKS